MNHKKSFGVLAIIALLFAFAGIVRASEIADYTKAIDSQPVPQAGQDYYLRNSIWYEKGKCDTTNYTRGALAPINTKVTLVAIDADKLTLRLPSGDTVIVANTKKYTNKDISTIARNLLSSSETSISGFSKDIQDAINNGEMILGMTKPQVIMARGWPPAHQTSSLDQNTWTYWSSNFVKLTIKFKDDKLSEGRGLK